MTGIRSRVCQLSLSAAGILILVLFVGLAFVPQELRANAVSRIAGVAQYFDTTLSDAWHAAFTSKGSEPRASAPKDHNGGGSHAGAPAILPGGETHLSAAARESLIDINGIEPGAFSIGAGAGSNSTGGLLGDILKD